MDHYRSHDRVQLTRHEAGAEPDELMAEAWARAGVAKVIPNRFGAELRFGAFVGTLELPSGLRLSIDELVPGTAEACIRIATPGVRQTEGTGGAVVVPAQEMLALRYVDVLERVLSRGARKEYRERTETSSRPRGKLLMTETVRGPWARGAQHRVVSRWRELTEDTALNRHLLSALVRADRVLSRASDRTRARSMMVSLGGAQLEYRPAKPGAAPGLEAAAVELAEVLIAGVPLSVESAGQCLGTNYWINVEQLFEDAVRVMVADLALEARVTSGDELAVSLLGARATDPHPQKRFAHPDVVIKDALATRLIDAKYRRSGENPGEEEIYQLMAHADAFGASAAALVCVSMSGRSDVRFLGRMRSGCSVHVVAVDPRDEGQMREMIWRWLSTTGQGQTERASVSAGLQRVSQEPSVLSGL